MVVGPSNLLFHNLKQSLHGGEFRSRLLRFADLSRLPIDLVAVRFQLLI